MRSSNAGDVGIACAFWNYDPHSNHEVARKQLVASAINTKAKATSPIDSYCRTQGTTL